MNAIPFRAPVALALLVTLAWSALAADDIPKPKPVPQMQAIPQPHQQISFHRDGTELARLHFMPAQHRPFVYPILGPSGRSLTRMGHPHDPVTHSHHTSFWVSHHDVDGHDFWGDRGKGRIRNKQVQALDDGPEECYALVLNEWLAEGKPLLAEKRGLTVRTLPNDEWLLILDLELAPVTSQVTLGKTPFGVVGVRMAKTIGVHDGGGTIRNSEGGINEKEVFWKPARWVDYSGPVTPAATEGITLLDHPKNPNHPSVFHVRNDGWMGASLTFSGARVIGRDEPLRLRYGLYVHSGKPSREAINKIWRTFSELSMRTFEP